MEQGAKIYIAGHRGLVGSAIWRALEKQGYTNLLGRTRTELDLTDAAATTAFFEQEKPDYVLVAAAKVGGIGANKAAPADFLWINLLIETNIVHAAYRAGVNKLLLLGTSAMYPKDSPQPMKPEYVMTGHLDPNVAPYALAKIAGLYLCQAYRAQYGCNFIHATPSNLYGVNDNWDLETSHVLPALLRKVHRAKLAGETQITIWGDGSPMREFLLDDDLADACIFLMNHYDGAENINVGSGEEIAIRDLADLIKATVGWEGTYNYDPSKPNGTLRKLMDTGPINALGWRPKYTLREGLRDVYREVFLQEGAPLANG